MDDASPYKILHNFNKEVTIYSMISYYKPAQ